MVGESVDLWVSGSLVSGLVVGGFNKSRRGKPQSNDRLIV